MKICEAVSVAIMVGVTGEFVVAQPNGLTVSDVHRVVNCVAQGLSSQNHQDFVSRHVLRFRFYDGGIPLTNQEHEPIQTIVLYSTDGQKAIIEQVEKGTTTPVRVLPFIDYFKRSSGGWSPVDVSGGPGTADVESEFLNRLGAGPLQKAEVNKVSESDCTFIPPQ